MRYLSPMILAHKLIRTIFFVLTRHQPYRDLGFLYEAASVAKNAPRWIKALSPRGFHGKLVLAIALLAATLAAQAQESFTPEDTVVSDPDISLFDQEFSPVPSLTLMTWQDTDGRLWLASIDPDTGAINPTSGRGLLIDTGLSPGTSTGNGPEWVYSAAGLEILYTKLDSLGRNSLARARRQGDDTWIAGPIADSADRYNVLGSQSKEDPTPYIVYFGPSRATYWREIDQPLSEEFIPKDGTNHTPPVKGERAVMMLSMEDGYRQCTHYDLDSRVLTPISTTPGHKGGGRMWRAPDFDSKVAYCIADENLGIEIYRQFGSAWQLINTITPPSQNLLVSPEYFVHNGKSYLAFNAIDQLDDFYFSVGDVWIVGIDPATPFSRKVSADDPATRIDVEVLAARNDVYLYYTEVVHKRSSITGWVAHRCASGLGPSQ